MYSKYFEPSPNADSINIPTKNLGNYQILAEHKTLKAETEPSYFTAHKHDYTKLIIIDQSEGFHRIDNAQYRMEKTSIFLLPQGSVHSFSKESVINAYTISFNADSLFNSIIKPAGIQNIIKTGCASLKVEPELLKKLINLHSILQKKLLETKNENNQIIINSLLTIILSECAENFHHSPLNSYSKLVNNFMDKVSKKIDAKTSVNEISHQLGVTPSYLSNLIQSELGQAPSKIIRSSLVSEVQRMLAYSDASIGEIANHFQFRDASYITVFMKRETGLTPKQFRNKSRTLNRTSSSKALGDQPLGGDKIPNIRDLYQMPNKNSKSWLIQESLDLRFLNKHPDAMTY